MNRRQRTRRLSFPCLEALDGRVLPSQVLNPIAHHVRPHAVHHVAISRHVAKPAMHRAMSASQGAFHAVNVGGPSGSSGATSGSFFYTLTSDGQGVYHSTPSTPDPTPNPAPMTVAPDMATAAPPTAATSASSTATTAPVASTNPSGTFFYTLVNPSDGSSGKYH